MDTIDDANSIADHFTSVAISNARASARALRPKGSCYYCDEPIAHGGAFCDEDCRDDFEKLERKQQFQRG